MKAIIVIKMIAILKLTEPKKEKLTACVFYNQQKRDGVNLQKRLQYCKNKLSLK